MKDRCPHVVHLWHYIQSSSKVLPQLECIPKSWSSLKFCRFFFVLISFRECLIPLFNNSLFCIGLCCFFFLLDLISVIIKLTTNPPKDTPKTSSWTRLNHDWIHIDCIYMDSHFITAPLQLF